jgi:hypothetical protein
MEQSPSWETDRPSADQANPHRLQDPEIHNRVRESLPLNTILSQIN